MRISEVQNNTLVYIAIQEELAHVLYWSCKVSICSLFSIICSEFDIWITTYHVHYYKI